MQFPSEKVKMRLIREACTQVAGERRSSFLTIEERYSMVRTNLVHFHHRAPGTAEKEVKQKLEELLPMAREFLAEAASSFPRERLRQISDATAKLRDAAVLFFKIHSIMKEDVQIFLRVLEVYREKCLVAHYNPSDILTTEVLLLGIMISTNFETHGESLNNAI